jgi:hypothetical protein
MLDVDFSGDRRYFKKLITCECCKIKKPVGDYYKQYFEGELQRFSTYAVCRSCRKTCAQVRDGSPDFKDGMDPLSGRNFIKFLESRVK